MRNIARVILTLVVVFVLGIAGLLVARSRSVDVEAVAAPPAAADLRIKEVDLEEETSGIRWRLKAEQALLYEQTGRTELRNLAVTVYERDRTWTIVGERGDVDRESRDVEIRGNVVVTSSDGLRLETPVLRWDAQGKRLWTDAVVRLSQDRSVVDGRGLEVRIEDESATVGGPVRARFVQ
ncbi:MAG TPA: LPS export ABC transporter periplasmic protein LptC, partial [Candidatus Tectomicrobia bacterium]|nr:LPS export ABC transporter periplasmic protein LptC [Candidatus Tectomicrobia bacterium]